MYNSAPPSTLNSYRSLGLTITANLRLLVVGLILKIHRFATSPPLLLWHRIGNESSGTLHVCTFMSQFAVSSPLLAPRRLVVGGLWSQLISLPATTAHCPALVGLPSQTHNMCCNEKVSHQTGEKQERSVTLVCRLLIWGGDAREYAV